MQKEQRICEKSFAHTQGKRVALYNPSPRQNTCLEQSCCRPGCSLHWPLSRVPGLFCAHASVAALVVWRLGPPLRSKGFLCPARPAVRIKWWSSPVAQLPASLGSTASRRHVSSTPHCICGHQAQALAESWQTGLLWSLACCRSKPAPLQLPPARGTPAKSQQGDQLLSLCVKRLLLDKLLWESLMTKQVVVMHPVLFSLTSALAWLQGPKGPPILLAVDTRSSESSQLLLPHNYALFTFMQPAATCLLFSNQHSLDTPDTGLTIRARHFLFQLQFPN